ncbi:MAG TPA: peroxidase family protein [Dongiaceae bacterium]|nr:peroxidase family protein [Dongiaceae bacterium]
MHSTKNVKRPLLAIVILLAASSLTGCARPSDEPIERWWKWDPISSVAYLAEQVLKLYRENFVDSYTQFPDNVDCGEETKTTRTVEGNCNDPAQTRMGSAGVRFGRNVALDASYPVDQTLMEPNPRTISRELMTRGEIKEVDFLSYWAAAWIQFMVHDWMAHQNSSTESHRVPLDDTDPLAGELGSEMAIAKTEVDPNWTPYENTPPGYLNRNTHWWDGSQLYGSDAQTAAQVRTFSGGKLKLEANGRLPVDTQTGLPLTGFNENWWLGLQMLHELFVKEHNAIAAMLQQKHPEWDDELLYNKARLINAAVMAKIHTVDWTPSILKNPLLNVAMNADWELAVGGPKALRGAPYSLTEDFVAVYRMHPLLRDEVAVRDFQSGALLQSLPTAEQAFQKAAGVMDRFGTANLFYSFGVTHPGQITTNNYPKFLQELRMPDGTLLDLAAVDILRDRERGVPRYNEFRRQLHMPPIRDFTDLTPDAELAEKLRTVYHNDVEAIDTLVGQLAEGYRPPGFGFSDTTFRIFTMMAPRRFQADRFYTSSFNKAVYTKEGMHWIREANMKNVIVRHVPELKTAMTKVGNPFFPWNTDSSRW